MRLRSALLLLGLIGLAALAYLNWGELARPVDVSFGVRTVALPLGMLLLGLAAASLLLALLSLAYDAHQRRRERQQSDRQLEAQRALADQAEGSRLAQVQRQLDLQAQAMEHRERDLLDALGQRLDHLQHSLQHQMDELGNGLAAHIGEVEDRLERRRILRPPADADSSLPYGRH